MTVEVFLKSDWIHVKYTGDVNTAEVLRQTRDPDFMEALELRKKIIYDYSETVQTDFSEENIVEFATLGRMLGNIFEHIDVACIPTHLDQMANMERAKRYREFANSPNWRVAIFNNLEEAQSYLAKC